MSTDVHDLTALLGSRICHDLISPLGAIGNGVELLSLSAISAAPEIALIAESVENANARIRFFRIAFGASEIGAQVVSADVRSILTDLTKGGRLRISWADNGTPYRSHVKLAFLLILCLETAMPWGGEIAITQDGKYWEIKGTSDRLNVNSDHWNRFSEAESPDGLDSAHVHFALAPATARRLNRRLSVDVGETDIRISF